MRWIPFIQEQHQVVALAFFRRERIGSHKVVAAKYPEGSSSNASWHCGFAGEGCWTVRNDSRACFRFTHQACFHNICL